MLEIESSYHSWDISKYVHRSDLSLVLFFLFHPQTPKIRLESENGMKRLSRVCHVRCLQARIFKIGFYFSRVVSLPSSYSPRSLGRDGSTSLVTNSLPQRYNIICHCHRSMTLPNVSMRALFWKIHLTDALRTFLRGPTNENCVVNTSFMIALLI